MNLAELISVARGNSLPDLLLKNARIVNTFIGEVEEGNVAICGDKVAGIGDYTQAREIIDLEGEYLSPALIDGHIHIESSMLHPARYAEAVVPRGILASVTDLHELANVCGIQGIRFVIDWGGNLPMDIFFMAPSCVPSTSLETSGARISVEEIEQILTLQNVIGLGEMMNFPGVINGDNEILRKINAAQGKIIDGHAPGLSGKKLNAYKAAGILSDHECTTFEEGSERLKRGMYLMIREGSSEKNLDALLPLINDNTYKRCFFVVDDRTCSDLLREGDVDAVVRKAISHGLDPIRALQLATINAAEYFQLGNLGAIAPGYLANLITFTELPKLTVDMVFYQGKLVAKKGKCLFSTPQISPGLTDTIHIKKPFTTKQLKLTANSETQPVIEIVPEQIITRKRLQKVKSDRGIIVSDIKNDILKLVVVERHKASGNIGVGLVKGFGLKKGALASSIAHDSHNIIAVGTNDADIFTAIEQIENLQGGLVVCAAGQTLASLPLPIAGLLSPEPLKTVVVQFEQLEKAAARLGNLPAAPFSILSFLALPVIPELRLTDLGLVDVAAFKLMK